MSTPVTVDEIVTAVNALAPEDRKALADKVVKEKPEGFEPLRAKAYAHGKRSVADGDLATARERIAALEGELETARGEVERASKGQPTPTEREAKLATKVEKLTEELRVAKDDAVKIRDESDDAQLRASMKGRLRDRYAGLVAPSLRSRIRVKADGTREVQDADGEWSDVPAGKMAWDVLAQMAVDEAEPVDRLVYADTGGGAQSGGGYGGNGGSGRGGYDPAKAGKAAAERQKHQAGDGKLAFR